MNNTIIKPAIRTLFAWTSKERAIEKIERHLDQYAKLARGVSKEAGQICVEVPPMRGVDEDMRRWSFFMILEHNAIVQRSVTATVVQLARGETLSDAARIDPKRDVMPSPAADASQWDCFAGSVASHIAAVRTFQKLRGTRTAPHPVFGKFDAHQWNCMFAFHMGLHLPQAEFVASRANTMAGTSHTL